MDKYFVSGVIDKDGECERVEDEQAQFWTLYERDNEGLSQGIADFIFREDAEAVMRVYAERDALAALTAAEALKAVKLPKDLKVRDGSHQSHCDYAEGYNYRGAIDRAAIKAAGYPVERE